jgi:hypothetical protein
MGYVHTLMTYGVSGTGADASLIGQPVTSPVDRIGVRRSIGAYGPPREQFSLEAVVDVRLSRGANPDLKDNARVTLEKEEKRLKCAALYSSAFEWKARAESAKLRRNQLLAQKRELEQRRQYLLESGAMSQQAWDYKYRELSTEISRFCKDQMNAANSCRMYERQYNELRCGPLLNWVPLQAYVC